MNTNTHIIPQSNQSPNNSPISNLRSLTYAAAFEESFVSEGAACHYCGKPAESCTSPPLCPSHLDLVIIISKLQKDDQPITTENALSVLNRGLSNGGEWAVTEKTLPHLLTDYLRQTRREDRP